MGNSSIRGRIGTYIRDAEESHHLDLTEAKQPIIDAFPWEEFVRRDSIRQLQRVDLVKCRLTQLPPLFPALKHLTVLRFADNRISRLPDELFECVSLQALNMNANRLSEISENIFKLTNLTDLQFANNQIRKLPAGIEQLRKLHTLNIDRNKIDFSSLSNQLVLMLIAVGGTYYNQRSPQKVVDGLYIGSITAARDLPSLKEAGITHIVTIATGPVAFPEHFKYLLIEIGDAPWENLKVHFPAIIAFIDEAIASGGNVLVHCVVGASRSASAVIAYLMTKNSLRYEEALTYLRSKRPFVWPNLGFQQQLIDYEDELFPDKKRRRSLARELASPHEHEQHHRNSSKSKHKRGNSSSKHSKESSASSSSLRTEEPPQVASPSKESSS